MAVELAVYQRAAPATLIAVLDQPYDVSWLDELTEVGAGTFTIPHDSPVVAANPSILDRGNIVRVRIGGTDRFGWVIDRKEREHHDSFDPIRVTGRGVLDLLRYAAVYPEYWPAEVAPDVRLFGYQAAAYDDAAWVAPSSWGTQGSNPFPTPRPEGWTDSSAHLITSSAAYGAPEGDDYYRATLTVPEDMDVRFECSADDEFDLWVAGVKILDSRGIYRWRNTYVKSMRMTAGSYQVAAKVHNFARNATTDATWFVFSAARGTSEGQPLAKQEVQQVVVDATGGTFTLTFSGQTTGAIAYNASSSTVESALEALSNIDGVTVTGSGTAANPWVVTWDDYDPKPQMTADGSALTGGASTVTVTTTVEGASPDVLLRSDTTNWKLLSRPANPPGMPVGQILRVLLTEAQARGVIPSVTTTFTDTTDTDGVAWPQVEFAAQVGNDSLLTLGQRLGDLDVDLHMSPALAFSAYATRGATVAQTITDAHCSRLRLRFDDEIVNVVMLRTTDAWHEAPDPAPSSDRWEGFLALGAIPSEQVARDVAGNVLDLYNNPREIVELTYPEELGPDPYVHFGVGDTITAPGLSSPTATAWAGRSTRVLSIAGEVTDAGTVEWTLEGEQ